MADTVVAKSGNTQMAFASCFGSPMLSHVLGLSVAFVVSNHHGSIDVAESENDITLYICLSFVGCWLLTNVYSNMIVVFCLLYKLFLTIRSGSTMIIDVFAHN